ncbi:PTS system, fructose-specific IIC component [Lachnospiraceae bacterium NE2001]|nr:PTS system, fructose-specific IIC component [Lachnospiraceae bacterium NE2001]
MKIIELLDKKSISLDAAPKSKSEALDLAVDLMVESGKIKDKEAYKKLVYAREEESTTGVGEGIAIPHGKGDCVDKPGLAAMVIKDGVDFEALDEEPVNILFLIAAPDTEDNVHLDVLSKLSMMLMDEDFRNSLINAKDVDEFIDIVDRTDEGRGSVDETIAETSIVDDTSGALKVVAVTSCPTGIAHTYMAAEGLEKAADKAGIKIKIETRGSSGAKNVLTDEDIAAADCVIVTADSKVPMDRFKGKKVIQRKVADGINKADELMGIVKAGSAPIFSGDASESSESEKTENQGSVGHKIYTWLMNGVSHMLPFVIGGGILVAIAFLIDTIAGYGATGGGDFGSITPLAALLKYIGGLAMGLMVPVLAGYIAYAIADRPGLAVGFVGGMLASNGNALLSGYTFAEGTLVDGKAIGGFGEFLSKFAFQQPDGGNTVSGFLGGIVAGFLAGFIVLGLQKLCANLPQALDGIKPTLIYPLVGIFLEGVIMCFILNPLIGLANTGLSHMLTAISDAGMLTVLGLILGAMMAIDMGGPINKAAYVFGVGMLTQASDYLNSGMSADDPKVVACYVSMAAIMVGGMVPPVGIALACWIFPKKFTKAERGSAVSNVVMGASFITEGAIPFAAADPLHTIPCTMVGAGVAGFLAALFKCTLMAPHGGLFVFATVGNPFMYIVAWLVGSAVTCIMLGLIKKPAEMNK